MGIYRTALLVAVSHANLGKDNHTYMSLTSGGSSIQDYSLNSNYYNYTSSHRGKGFKTDLNQFHGNVNVLLGGAMLIVISTIVCLICYCCHRKTKMRASLYMQHHRWFDSDYNMEVYSVEQYCGMTSLHDSNETIATMRNINERPPSYECIMALSEALKNQQKLAVKYDCPIGDLNIELPPSDGIDSKNLDVNGNIAQSITQCNINDCLNNNNNNNEHHPTTSSSSSSSSELSNNVDENAATTNNENDINGNSGDNAVNWDISRANGIVKLDMSRIMDSTGLPTYEAALTLKSSNYI